MPGAPRKTVKVQALVNLSLARVEKDASGNSTNRARIVQKGTVLDMTEAEVANFGRLVRVIDDEHPALTKVGNASPASVLGIKSVNKAGKTTLQGTGALDMVDNTRVYRTEAERDWEAQPTNNPIDPSYRAE